MIIDIFFYNPDIGKKIEEANYLQSLQYQPAIHRTLNTEYKEEALKGLGRKFVLARSLQNPSAKGFDEMSGFDKNLAGVTDSLDLEHINKLKSEKDYKKIISLLREPVALIEKYGVDRLQEEHRKKSELLKDLENDELYQQFDKRYHRLAKMLGIYGNALKERGELNSASHYLMQAAEMNPYDWEPYYDMACIYEKKGEHAKAVNFYRAAGNLSDAGTFLSEIGSSHVREAGRKDLKKPEEKEKRPSVKVEEVKETSPRKGNWRENLKKKCARIWESIKGIF